MLHTYLGQAADSPRNWRPLIEQSIRALVIESDSTPFSEIFANTEAMTFLESDRDLIRSADLAFKGAMNRKAHDALSWKFFTYWGNLFRTHPSFASISMQERWFGGLPLTESFFGFDEAFANCIRVAIEGRDSFVTNALSSFDFTGFPKASAAFAAVGAKPADAVAPPRLIPVTAPRPFVKVSRTDPGERLEARAQRVLSRAGINVDNLDAVTNEHLEEILGTIDKQLAKVNGRMATSHDEELLLVAYNYLLPYYESKSRSRASILPAFKSPVLKAVSILAATPWIQIRSARERETQRAVFFKNFTVEEWRALGNNYFVFGSGDEWRELRYDILRLGGAPAIDGLFASLMSKSPSQLRKFFFSPFGLSQRHERALRNLDLWGRGLQTLTPQTISYLLVPERTTRTEQRAAAALGEMQINLSCEVTSAP